MTLDVHTHPVLFREGSRREDVRRLVDRARSFGIQRMVALGDVLRFGRLPNARQISTINEETAQLLRWHPDVFIGFCHLNPMLGERAMVRELERLLPLGFRGLKLEISNNARAACMRPLMRLAERHDLVVLQHSWSMTRIRERAFHSDPADTAELAKRFPNVRVIMAHLTGCGVRGILEVKAIDNLVVDTSGAAPEEGVMQAAVEHLGAERILYGSDWPIRDFPVALARITASGLGLADQRRILGENARRWLRLP